MLSPDVHDYADFVTSRSGTDPWLAYTAAFVFSGASES
jgi:hypothetical protein